MLKRILERFITYKKAFVYRIYDPRNVSLSFYIGKTSRTVQKRLQEHIKDHNYKHKSKLPISCFIRYLLENENTPAVEIIEEYNSISLYDLNLREKYFISFFRVNNYKILNATEGGDGRSGYTTSDETKEKMSLVHKNRTRSKREKKNAVMLGKYWLGKKRDLQEWPEKRRKQNSIKYSGEGNPRAKLTKEDVILIKKELRAGVSQHAIALEFNISRSVIANIKIGNIWCGVE